MNLSEVIELLREGVGLTERICIRDGNTELNLHNIYIEDYSNGLCRVILGIKGNNAKENIT